VGDAAKRLWGVVEPYVAAEGVELDDVELLGGGGARIVRVVLDAEGSLDVGRLADLSRGISRLLDAEDPIPGAYTLEVTTPGLERKLRRPEHFRKSLGREVKVKTHEPVAGARSHRGVLVATDDDGFELEIDGARRRIGYGAVASARTVFVWEKSGRPGKDA